MRATFFALLPLALVALPLLGLRRAPKIALAVEGQELVVRLGRWDALYCLKRELRFPVAEVVGVAVLPSGSVPRRGLRLPGTELPGVIRAGSYGRGPARDFWDVRKGKRYLVVALLPVASYRRLVFEVADPDEQARHLQPALGALTDPLRR